MSDEIDKAQEMDGFLRQIAIMQSVNTQPVANFTGFCFHCEEPVSYPRRWCNADCRDDWEKEAV